MLYSLRSNFLLLETLTSQFHLKQKETSVLESDSTHNLLHFRWEAGQILGRKLMLNLVADFQKNNSLVLNPKFVDGIRSILKDTSLDKVCTILVLIFLFLSKNVVPNVIASML